MADASNKLAKFTLLVAAIALPSGAALYFRDNPIPAAIGAEAVVLVTAFLTKVWDKLEAQYVDAVAQWLPSKLHPIVTRYRARYRRATYFQHRSFDVKGLNTQGAFSLELDQVFVDLALSPEAPHKVPTDPLRKPDLAGERREIWHFLKSEHYRHLAILGPPGSGKTTLLKHAALALAGPRRQRPLRRTPVLLYLRDLQSAIPQLTLADAIRQSLPKRFEAPPRWVENELDSGRCLILLDGLDEVADGETRRKVAHWVEKQMKEFNETLFIVTSRPNGYLSNPIDGVTVLDVKPFTWPQVEKFAHNWYLATETVRAGKRDPGVELQAESGAKDLLQRLAANPALTDLAVNPLLLTMITTVHKERNSLPGRRVELYREICDVFLGKRQASKGIVLDLTPAQKQRVLEPLAWDMMERNLRVIGATAAESLIAPVLSLVDPNVAPPKFLTSVRDDSGLLIERENGEYAFAHLTFQEYLASVHAKAPRCEDALVARVDDPWWAETIRLYAAQNNATRIVEACTAGEDPTVEALALAMDCRDEGLEVSPAARARVDEIVVAGLDSDDVRRRRQAAEVQLVRYLQSMLRIAEGTYGSKELVPCGLFGLFVRDRPHFKPVDWPNVLFGPDSRKRVLGVTPIAAVEFCSWLSERDSQWHYELPGDYTDPELGPHWVQVPQGLRCLQLPAEWVAYTRSRIEKRVAQDDYLRARTLDIELARSLRGPVEIDLGVALTRAHELNRSLGKALGFHLELDLGRDLDLTRARGLDLGGARTRAYAHARTNDFALGLTQSYLAELEALSFLLMNLMRSGSISEAAYADLFLAAALAQEQQAGNIPPHPAGIALIRRRATQETELAQAARTA